MLTKITAVTQKFFKNTSGATAIEYGLIAAGIAIAIVAIVGTLGDQLLATFERVSAALAG